MTRVTVPAYAANLVTLVLHFTCMKDCPPEIVLRGGNRLNDCKAKSGLATHVGGGRDDGMSGIQSDIPR